MTRVVTSAEQRLIEEASDAARLLDNIDNRVKQLLEGQPTLRDRFAMAALPAVAGNATAMVVLDERNPDGDSMRLDMARACYNIADAMLKARGGAQ